MTMRPGLRRFVLTAHVVSSVGWLGAILAFFALSIAGLTVDDEELVRAAYLAMDLTVWSALVPLAAASLMTGLIQAFGTKWGLFRHYWVLAKLVLTVIATAVLLIYTQTISDMADVALESADVEAVRNPSPALHAAAAVLILLIATILAVYKPRGLTRYGWRKQQQRA